MNRLHKSRVQSHPLLWWMMRGVWTCLAVMHLWPLVILAQREFTTPSLADTLWLISLIVAIGVFTLKAVDAALLRVHRPGMEFVVFVIAAALIHGNAVVDSELPALTLETATVVVVVAGGGVIGHRRLKRRLSEMLCGLMRRVSPFWHDRHQVGFLNLVACYSSVRVVLCCEPARAPPSLIV